MDAKEELELAYIAGIVDGEGHVGIAKRMPGKNNMVSPKYSCRLGINMCEPEAINLIMAVFEIDTHISLRTSVKSTQRPCWQFSVENGMAVTILKAILPYLRIKADQAECVIKLRGIQTEGTRRDRQNFHMEESKRKGTWQSPVGILSKDHLDKCEELYLLCKHLNRRGPR